MPTTPPTFTPRDSLTQSVKYFRQTVAYNSTGVGSTAQQFGMLPKNALIIDVKAEIVTAFNAGTTNPLTLGTTTTANELVTTGDLNAANTGISTITRGFGTGLTVTADTKLYWKYAPTGTAATTGKANFVISYIPDNDN